MLNLQTLILRGCRSLRELPKGIKKLVNLQFLDITYCSRLIDMFSFLGLSNDDQLTSMPLEIRHHTYLVTILPGVFVRMEDSRGQVKKGYCRSYKKKMAKSNGPSQLKELHNLGGYLRIENLGHGKDKARECKDANLKEKHHLQQLLLEWDASEWDAETDEMLEGLQPHPNLKVLELQNYMGVRIPSWVSSLTNLLRFGLNKNRRLQHLPLLNQLPFLKFVTLVEMEALEYIWIDEESVSNVLGASTASSSSKTSFFPSLSSLEIRYCLKLKGWWRNLDDDDNEPHHLLLPSLSELVIDKCPNLTYMPAFPYLKERLELSGCSWKVLEQTMKMKMGAATTSTYFTLSQLQKLQLDQISNFDSLPEEGLRSLISLKELYIQSCDGLVSLPWIGILTSLQTLKIMRCPNLTSLPQEIRNLTSLKELYISGSPNLMSIPQEIRNLTFLKELYISGCPNLTTLPQEIRNLPLI